MDIEFAITTPEMLNHGFININFGIVLSLLFGFAEA
jgi:hypothetical protein